MGDFCRFGAALGKLDHVGNVTNEIDLEGAPPQGDDVDPLDNTAQDFCGLRMAPDRHAERVYLNSASSFYPGYFATACLPKPFSPTTTPSL